MALVDTGGKQLGLANVSTMHFIGVLWEVRACNTPPHLKKQDFSKKQKTARTPDKKYIKFLLM